MCNRDGKIKNEQLQYNAYNEIRQGAYFHFNASFWTGDGRAIVTTDGERGEWPGSGVVEETRRDQGGKMDGGRGSNPYKAGRSHCRDGGMHV